MEDKRFDKIIEDMINEYEVKYSFDSWRRLEQKLNYEEKEDELFDKVIAYKLNNFSVPVSTGSYSRFEKKTKSHGPNSYRNIIFALGIAASFLLILLTIGFNKFFNNKKSASIPITSIQAENEDNISDQTVQSHDMTIKSPARSELAFNAIYAHLDKSKNKSTTGFNEKIEAGVKSASDFGIKFSFFKNNPNNLIANTTPRFEFGFVDFLLFNTYGNIEVPIIYSESNLAIEIPKAKDYPKIVRGNIFNINSDNSIHFGETQNNGFQSNNEDDAIIDSDIDQGDAFEGMVSGANKKEKWNAELFGSPVFSLLKTPNDLTLKIPGYTHHSIGYNFGIGLSRQTGKHEFGLGFEYQTLSYSPKKVIVAQGNKSFWLDNIGINKIRIPLFYRFQIASGKKIDIYASASITPQLNTSSRYEFIESEDGIGSLSKLAKELIENNDFKQTLYAEKEYDIGILEGGSASGNSSLALNFGVGLKTRLSHSISFFIEPGIGKSIINSSFGPNNDKLTSVYLKMGINKSFNL